MFVIKDGAHVLSASVPYSITTPYTEAQLPYLIFTQDADVMTITHPSHAPRELARTGHAAWTLTTISFAPTTTAPGAPTLATIGAGPGTYNKTYEYVVTAVIDGVESLPSPLTNLGTASLTTTAGINVTWTSVSGADYYRVYKATSFNSGRYGWIGDTESTSFKDFNTAPVVSDQPPAANTPFTGTDNRPAAVNYYQQRLMYGNTNNKPQALFASQIGIYNSMRGSRPLKDDDSIEFVIAANQVNEIRHIVSVKGLLLITPGGVWRVTEGQEGVLTPSSIGAKIESYHGGSWVRPVIIGDTMIYIQDKGGRVRDFGYVFADDDFTGNDLSLLSEHLIRDNTIEEMAYAEEPDGIVWMIRDDGVLLGLTYQREHEVTGWHQHTTDGEFESVATISEDGRDAVYFIVKRTIDGNTVRYVERLEPRYTNDVADSFFVDSGLTYDGSATTAISGLDHLEGETLAVLADGVVVNNMTVSSGAITLPKAASKVHAGLPYTPVMETLDIDSGKSIDPVKARKVSVSRVTVEVEDSRGMWVGPKDDKGVVNDMRETAPRSVADGYGVVPLNNYKKEVIVDPLWGDGGGVKIEQRDPVPLAILSVTPELSVGG